MTITKNIEKVTVIGLGSSGVKIAQSVAAVPANNWLNIHGIDTDKRVVEGSSLSNKHLVSQPHDSSLGCGGNVIKGSRLIARERKLIKEIILSSSLVVVTGGFGGGTMTGGAKIIASVAAEINIPCVFIVTTPFALEGDVKRKTAADGIDDLLTSKGLIFPLANDLIFSTLDGDSSAKEAFECATEHMSLLVSGFCDMMRCEELLKIDFSTMYNVMNKKSSQCSLGNCVVEVDDCEDVTQRLLDGVLNSPFMGGKKYLSEADAVFFIISAGEDIDLKSIKNTLTKASELVSVDTALCAGAALNKALDGKIMLNAVAVRFLGNYKATRSFTHADSLLNNTPENKQKSVNKSGSFFDQSHMHNRGQQLSSSHNLDRFNNNISNIFSESSVSNSTDNYEEVGLGLIHFSRGYFETTPPNRFNGEDLDAPTFQRRNITIKK